MNILESDQEDDKKRRPSVFNLSRRLSLNPEIQKDSTRLVLERLLYYYTSYSDTLWAKTKLNITFNGFFISSKYDEDGFEKVNYKCPESKDKELILKSKELEQADDALQKKR